MDFEEIYRRYFGDVYRYLCLLYTSRCQAAQAEVIPAPEFELCRKGFIYMYYLFGRPYSDRKIAEYL